MKREIMTIRNSASEALHCVFHAADSTVVPRDIVCLLLSPGVKMRVAPHRLYEKLVPEFLERGIHVLRVDFHGLGDSDGELPDERLDTLYRAVQLGRHVDDVLSAMSHLGKKLGFRKFLVGGLCGGALTGLLAAERDSRIAGLYAVGIPVILDGTGQHESVNMSRGQLNSLRNRYVAKVLSAAAWRRFLSARTDYRLLISSLFGQLKRRGRQRSANWSSAVPRPASPLAQNLNPEFVRAMFHLIGARIPALLLFSGADRLQWEFQEKFLEPWSQAIQRAGERLIVETIPNANHVLGDPAWVAEARRATATWLDRFFSGELRA
jgi:pimeloyl-ACP methyl ester carboxylesterase